MSWTDLEARVDRELKAMPAPEAPATLLPNVMRAVALAAARPTPWYSRAWLTWPRLAQAASLAFVLMAAVAAWREVPAAWTWAMGEASAATPIPAWFDGVADFGARVLALARVPWQILEPVASYFGLLALAASLVMAVFWFAFTRLNAGGVSIR